ncbi:TetR/AcrR family transcriptional regulator [Actinoplanes flavus]|uniref:TetR family transcriptional regulator n=1 Tax=Actinoplanes flavus TaxID=2820290 RepID=A0ABS3UG25_9ACTN|nr:TetR family transcriptional regulator [Actinoplanes flavus]MBO3737714.1 TetR family transcriptional regulator [Actinoplanes flavus]
MATVVDRRVRRTRPALRAALLDLMAERRYESVTVQDVIDRADVGRSTFYNHYTDKDALLRDCLAGLNAIITALPTTQAERRLLGFAVPLLRHVHQQRSLAAALLGESGNTVLRQIERMLTDTVRDAFTVGEATPRVPVSARARFVVGAFLGLVDWWLSEQPELSPEQVGVMFHTLAGNSDDRP